MRNRFHHSGIGCCAVIFCAASCYAQIDSCAYLLRWKDIQPSTDQEYRAQRDTLKLYIEKCAASDNDSWTVFTRIDGAVRFMSDDPARFDIYRNWLISVLYLNKTNPEYFCVCLGSIAGSYQIGKFYPLGYLAVLNWGRQSHLCNWG